MILLRNSFFKILKKIKIPKYFYKKGLKNSRNLLKKEIFLYSDKVLGYYKILFLSDLHLDLVDNSSLIIELLKEDKFDIVLFGGDYIDNDKNFFKIKNNFDMLLKNLNYDNVFFVRGNHDKWNVISYLKNKNLLINNSAKYKELNIIGLDINNDFFSLKEHYKKELFNLTISHYPDRVLDIIKQKIKTDFFISGHTHNGQIRFSFYAPIKNTKIKDIFYGNWIYKKTKGYTSSGVGCSSLPIRFGTNPEIVVLHIK